MSAYYLENYFIDFDQILHLCIAFDNISIEIVACQFLPIFKRIMALDFCLNFISAQYFENKCMNFAIENIYIGKF